MSQSTHDLLIFKILDHIQNRYSMFNPLRHPARIIQEQLWVEWVNLRDNDHYTQLTLAWAGLCMPKEHHILYPYPC